MRIFFSFFLVLQIIFGSSAKTFASDKLKEAFEAGVASFEGGKTEEAIGFFQDALHLSEDDYTSSNVILNLCASYVRAQEPGSAVAYCSAATNESINNSFAKEYLRQSLSMASLESQLKDLLDQQIAGTPWARMIGRIDWLAWGMLSLYLCGFFFTLICYGKLDFLPLKLLLLVFAFATTFQFATGAWILKNKESWGAIIKAETEVLASPNPNAIAIAKPKPGVPVELIKAVAGWNQIQLLSGEKGWILKTSALFPSVRKSPLKPQKEALNKD